ncbi:MAG: hypothetical protein ACE5HO_00535 [bacterium]
MVDGGLQLRFGPSEETHMEDEVREFLETLSDELTKQTRTLSELRQIVEWHNSMRHASNQSHGWIGPDDEKEKLLSLILAHSRDLTNFQKIWVTQKNRFSLAAQRRIQDKINELKEVVSDILDMEGRQLPRVTS